MHCDAQAARTARTHARTHTHAASQTHNVTNTRTLTQHGGRMALDAHHAGPPRSPRLKLSQCDPNWPCSSFQFLVCSFAFPLSKFPSFRVSNFQISSVQKEGKKVRRSCRSGQAGSADRERSAAANLKVLKGGDVGQPKNEPTPPPPTPRPASRLR